MSDEIKLKGIADKIARHIFEIGDEPESKTQRLQFMGGKYPDEVDQGGLNEIALCRVILEALKIHMNADN